MSHKSRGQYETQRAIFYVQRELEKSAEVGNFAIVLCDPGTVDCAAYWPGEMDGLWSSVGIGLDVQLRQYRQTSCGLVTSE